MSESPVASAVMVCRDTTGITHRVTGLLHGIGANVVNLQEHIEDGMFFMRIAWEVAGGTPVDIFAPAQEEYTMQIEMDLSLRRKRVGLLCSKEGHVVLDVLARHACGELPLDIAYIMSNAEEAGEWARKFGVPYYYTPTVQGSWAHEELQLKILQENPTDVLGFARYMKVVSPEFIRAAGQRIINVHHSFLPSFVGAKPYEEAHMRGVKLIGATAHYVTDELDQGPILQQEVQRVSHVQSVENLKLNGRDTERKVFAFALKKHVENKIIWYRNRTIIFE